MFHLGTRKEAILAEQEVSKFMPSSLLEERARSLVYGYVKSSRETANELTLRDVRLVWFSKNLKNWKATVMTKLDDVEYYELTHNGETGETYLDVYTKIDQVVFKDE